MRYFSLFCVCYIACTAAAFAQKNAPTKPVQDSIASKFGQTILAADLNKHLSLLSSPEFMGRGNGQNGQKIAEKYLISQFEQIGLMPKGNAGGYSQTVPLTITHKMDATVSINGNDYTFLKDFYCFNRSTALLKTTLSEVIFAGYGIEEKQYNNYENIDVRGKTVLILNGEPSINGVYTLTKSQTPSAWSDDRRKKIEIAKTKGAKNLLVITPNITEKVKQYSSYIMGENMMQLAADVKGENPKESLVNTFFISEEMGRAILGKNWRKYYNRANAGHLTPKKARVKSLIDLQVNKDVEEIEIANVLGFIEGTDLKEEVVVLTAHYDHLGIEHGETYYGADDDGSGTAALLEIAQAFAIAKAQGAAPKRSILIMPVSGEEKGLLGSRYYTDIEPLVPLKNIVADLNIDMIGRIDSEHKEGNYVYVIGDDKLSSELHEVSENMNAAYTKLNLDYRYNVENEPNQFYYRSDHYNFAKNGIPVIFYFNGTHPDYHKPSDTIEKIDFKAMEQRTKLVFYTAWELANRKNRIVVDSNKK